MKLKCLVVDDEQPAIEKLRTYIGRIPYLELVACCDNASEVQQILSERNDVDAIFADINMPDINGIDLVESLGNPRPEVVFITAYSDFAVDSYRMGALDYLLKPYSFEDFSRAVSRIVEKRFGMQPDHADGTHPNDKSFFIKVDSRWIKLRTAEVEYIQAYGDYLRVFVTGRANPLLTYSTLSTISEVLPDYFIQVHRSYIVNMESGAKIVERSRIITTSDSEIPIGEIYRERVANYLAVHSIGRDNRRKNA